MAQSTCQVDGCPEPVQIKSRGLCGMHYARWRQTGEVGEAARRRHSTPQPCSVDGCEEASRCGGHCNMHYIRMRAGGDAGEATARLPARPSECVAEGCHAPPTKRRWVCATHNDGTCAIEDCPAPVQGRGWCKLHWQQWKRTGDPLGTLRQIDPAPRGMKTCGTCGKVKPLTSFSPHPEGQQGRTAHCKPCMTAYHRRRYQDDPEPARQQSWRSRMRRLAAWVEDVDRRTVYERDNGVCGLCGRADVDPCDFHVDHIIPISRGGEHSYANVQLAHPACNLRKHARLPGELAEVEF